MEGRLHQYFPARFLNLFEYTPSPSIGSRGGGSTGTATTGTTTGTATVTTPPNILLFVGGLFDNFLSPKYVSGLAGLFPRHHHHHHHHDDHAHGGESQQQQQQQQFGLCHIQLSSCIRQFGTGSITSDVEEIAQAVRFLRSTLGVKNVVLMGHSTGCQDVLSYLWSPPSAFEQRQQQQQQSEKAEGFEVRPAVQGAILQAAVSDRDYMMHKISVDARKKQAYNGIMELIDATPAELRASTILPLHLTKSFYGPVPIGIPRFLSQASPGSPAEPDAEDLFSQDGTEAWAKTTFGAVGSMGRLRPVHHGGSGSGSHEPRLLILLSGEDEYYPPNTDQNTLLMKWTKALMDGGSRLADGSGTVAGANHDFSGNSPDRELELRKRVLGYLDSVVGGVDETAWRLIDGKGVEEVREAMQGTKL